MTTRLSGAVALITGGGSGIGAATARLFAEEGASVVVADRNTDAASAVAADIGGRAAAFTLDVADQAAWARAVDFARETFGEVTALVNSAGIVKLHSTVEATREDFQQVIDVNQLGVVFGIQAVYESMKRAGGGSIVNIASMAASRAQPGIVSYTATKWAVRGITKAAALELVGDGIRVNAIIPGHIRTPFNPMEYDSIPAGRMGEAEDVARAALFLASAESAYSTGTDLYVDGGLDIAF